MFNLIHFLKKYKKAVTLLMAMGTALFAGACLADTTAISMTVIASTIDTTVANLSTVLIDVALIAGIGFILASFFKFHQHKQNPTQVQMSQGISLLLIGCGLTLIPILIPTASQAILGTDAKTAQIGGSDIHGLIGDGS